MTPSNAGQATAPDWFLHAAEQLDFEAVLNHLAELSTSQETATALKHIAPIGNKTHLELHYQRLENLITIIQRHNLPPLREITGLAAIFRRLHLEGAVLAIEELWQLGRLCRATDELKRYFKQADPNPWKEKALLLEPHREFAARIERTFSPQGEWLDTASPLLASLRRRIDQARQAAREYIHTLAQKLAEQGLLSDDQPTIKGGRLVLPFKTFAKRSLPGIIVDQSNTGATTYVEPYEVIERNNQIRSMELELRREQDRILAELSSWAAHLQADLEFAADFLAQVDYFTALARYSLEYQGTLPHLNPHGKGLKLIRARNPVLALQQDVVPLDLELDPSISVLLISGPNAGGKTVALKTIGLAALHLRCGLPFPAKEWISPFWSAVFTDIGDWQSVAENLSTFSSHIRTWARILEEADKHSLVLLDEIGTGTDPQEGAALAQAILEKLSNQAGLTVADTHLSSLKGFAQNTPGIVNGSLLFDSRELRPLFRFKLGLPGGSYGLEIAGRYGLPAHLVRRARSLAGSETNRLEQLLSHLEQVIKENEALREKLQDQFTQQQAQQKTLENAIKEAERNRHQARQEALAEAERWLAQARRELEHLVKDIRVKQADNASRKAAREHLRRVELELQRQRENFSRAPSKEKEAIQVGSWVYVPKLQRSGQLVEFSSSGKAWVAFDDKKVQLPAAELEPATPPDKSTSSSKSQPVTVYRQAPSRSRLDLRGMRADEARQELEQFLDKALLDNLGQVEIIHGKGQGILAKMVQEVLSRYPAVKKFNFAPYGAGDSGVTIVELD